MYEYEISVLVEDKKMNQHIIKRYYVLPITGRYQLKEIIEDKFKKDDEITQYKLISYNVDNWYDVCR